MKHADGHCLPHRPEDEGPQPPDAIRGPAVDDPAHEAAEEHEGEHLRAAGRGMSEVGRVRDDVRLRGRHRDAAAEPGGAQEALHGRGGETERPAAAASVPSGIRRYVQFRAQQQGERRHHHQAENPDPHPRLAPAHLVDSDLQQGRPHGARQIGAADYHGSRDSAPAVEPVGDVRDQRDHHAGHAEESDQESEREHNLPQRGGLTGKEQSGRDGDAPDEGGPHDADPVRPPAHQNAAEAESGKQHRVGEGDPAARRTEVGRDGLQGDDDGIEPGEPDRHDGNGGKDPHPGVGGIDALVPGIREGAHPP